MTLSHSEKSQATGMWNRGKRELEIAQWLDRPAADVKAYLKTRPGWPGKIKTQKWKPYWRAPKGEPPTKPPKKRERPEDKTADTNGCRPDVIGRRGQWGGPRPGSGRKKGSPANGAAVKDALVSARAKAALRGVVTLQRVRAIDDHRWTCPVRVMDRTPRIWESV